MNINDCIPNPCKRWSICHDLVNDFWCECRGGWEGKVCDEATDECSPNPCQNNGTCTDLHDDYSCACAGGWEGKNCTGDIDDCARVSTSPAHHYRVAKGPCNNAVCTDHLGYHTCECWNGWEGADCDTDIDECTVANPCQNGAVCTNTAGSYTCACSEGYVGKNCETQGSLAYPERSLYVEEPSDRSFEFPDIENDPCWMAGMFRLLSATTGNWTCTNCTEWLAAPTEYNEVSVVPGQEHGGCCINAHHHVCQKCWLNIGTNVTKYFCMITHRRT